MSPFVRITDLSRTSRNVSCVQIVLQKFFLAGDGNFLEPLMRFARGDVRVHIGSHKNDHGPLYPSYRALQRRRRLKIDLREIFGVARFSTFATLSALFGHGAMSDLSPLCASERTSTDDSEFMGSRPSFTLHRILGRWL